MTEIFFSKKKFFIFLFSAQLLLSAVYSETINFSADSMTGIAGSDTGTTTLSGNAYILTDTMEIHADEITLSGKDYRYISASGNVKGHNSKSLLDFTCTTMKYDRQTKIVLLKDGVHLIDEKNEVTADAEIIEYNQDTDVAVMSIQVNLIQKDNNCTASYAIYKKNEQLLDLSGNPKITQGDDTFRAQTITLNLNTNEIELDGRVKGSVVSKNDDNTQNNAADSKTEEKETLPAETEKEEKETLPKEPKDEPDEKSVSKSEDEAKDSPSKSE